MSAQGWCTNWGAFNTPRLWAMVANEDSAESWRQVAALGAMADTVKDQRNRLIKARDALMQAWPPEKNDGAKAFLTQMDTLLLYMDDTKRQADVNATALGHVVEELRKAKEQLQPIYEEYRQKSDDLVPGWWDHAEDELDEKARKVMIGAEQAVAPHAEKIAPPEPYTFDDGSFVGGPQPPITAKGSDGSGRPGGGSGSTATVAVPHNPPPTLPGHEAYLPVGSGPGMSGGTELAGIPVTSLPPVTPPGPAIPTPGGPLSPPLVPGGMGWLPSGSGWGSPSAGGPLRPFGGARAGAMPSGAVIGNGSTGIGRGATAKPVRPSWLPEEVTPSGERPAGAGANNAIGGPMTQGSRSSGGRGKAGTHFDPDNPWATAEGVDPIIAPSQKVHRHDPGPGVIGLTE